MFPDMFKFPQVFQSPWMSTWICPLNTPDGDRDLHRGSGLLPTMRRVMGGVPGVSQNQDQAAVGPSGYVKIAMENGHL
jgi:hypothetical protein